MPTNQPLSDIENRRKVKDFIYWLEKYVNLDEKYTDSQIAQIIGKGMVDFFEESNTSF